MKESGISRSSREAGFTLVETLIASAIAIAAVVALGQMFAASVQNNVSARDNTYAQVLAQQKLEQLRSLAWGFDAAGLPISDTSTDTALPVESPAGGTGLSASPAAALTRNTAGYVDYVDRFGTIIGGGDTAPPRAVYVRRWAIEPVAGDPDDTLVLQVFVTRRLDRVPGGVGSTARLRDEARVTTARTRKAP